MTAKQMTESQIARFVRSMEDQSVGITRTKKGLLLRLPNGETTTLHFTNSDVRAVDNLIGRLRRAGVRHPDDSRSIETLPKQITESGQPAPKTRQKILNAIAQLDYPTTIKVPDVIAITNLEHITVSRALFHMDFRPIAGKRNSRDWLTPVDILDLRPGEQEPTPEEEAEVVESIENPDFVEVERPTESPTVHSDLQFIDTRDSWTVDVKELMGHLWPMVEDRLTMLTVLGMEYEFRVWRKP